MDVWYHTQCAGYVKEDNITIIGIDPGTGRLGYAVIDATPHTIKVNTYGVFEFQSTMPIHDRLVAIEDKIGKLLERYNPKLMSIETLIFNRNITTAMQVSEARGVIICTAARRNIPIHNCSPLQVKMAITGYGRADKQQVKQMVKLQCGLQEMHKLDDAVDALAIGITGFHLATTKMQ